MKRKQKKLDNYELAAFFEQMAVLLSAGISAYDSLSLLLEDAETQAEADILQRMAESFHTDDRLSRALKAAGVFPPYAVSMTELGESSGTCDEVFSRLSGHYYRAEELAESARCAVYYPVVIIGLMLLVVTVLMVKIVPVFENILSQFGKSMNVGLLFSAYARFFYIPIIVLLIFSIAGMATSAGRKFLRRAGHYFKPVAEIFDLNAAGRFAGGMGIALKSGLSPEESMAFSADVSDDEFFCRKVKKAAERIADGEDPAAAMREADVIHGSNARLLSIAWRTGKLDEAMEKISAACAAEADEKISGFIAALEPTLVIVLSVIVGSVLLSVMLPLLSLIAGA